MTRLERLTTQLEHLRQTQHQLIDWNTHITNLLANNTTAIASIERTIANIRHPPCTLTKYERVVKLFEENFDTYLLQLSFPENENAYSEEELQAIEFHFRELSESIASDPQLHL